jgi:hypothetical protein
MYSVIVTDRVTCIQPFSFSTDIGTFSSAAVEVEYDDVGSLKQAQFGE